MRKLRTWLKSQFGKLFAMPLYFRALAKEWNSILFGETLVSVGFLIWWSLASPSNPHLIEVFVVAMFVAGFYAWHGVHTRLEKKLEIAKINWREWTIQIGEQQYHRANAYEIEIINRSEGETVEGVSVQLSEVFPQMPAWEFLPIPLHLRHDDPKNPQDQKREFTLNPQETRKIDFISALEGDTKFDVIHVQHGVHHSVPYTGNNRLKVRITARNMPASDVWFKVWRDDAGRLQCEMEPPEKKRNEI